MILARVIVEDYCILWSDLTILINLWEADVIQSDYILCHKLTRQSFDRIFLREVLEYWKAGRWLGAGTLPAHYSYGQPTCWLAYS
jgi:hypothetical protein